MVVLQMENPTIHAVLRQKQTHNELTKMRIAGQTAVSLSGQNMDAISLSIATLDLEKAILAKKGLTISVDGQEYVTTVAQVNRHIISHDLLTVSLFRVATP